MTRELFKECLRKVEAVSELSEKLSEFGIDTLDCKELFYGDDIFFSWIEWCFGENGAELVSWWLYEDTDKTITEENGDKVNLDDIDDLYSYLELHYRKIPGC